MKEKITAFFQNEKVKDISKKVFNKRTLIGAATVLVVAVALRTAYSYMFEVKGYVSKVEGSKVTVVDFLSTRTVDISAFQNSVSSIQAGDRIVIMKNLSGQVMSVRDESKRNMSENGRLYNGHNFRGNDGHNFKRR